MIPGPPENKSMPGPRDDAPHGAKPGQRRRARPPVRDVAEARALVDRIRARRERLGPVDIDLVEELRKMREGEE